MKEGRKALSEEGRVQISVAGWTGPTNSWTRRLFPASSGQAALWREDRQMLQRGGRLRNPSSLLDGPRGSVVRYGADREPRGTGGSSPLAGGGPHPALRTGLQLLLPFVSSLHTVRPRLAFPPSLCSLSWLSEIRVHIAV